jgi:amino acid adenylation domain-containing protein
MSQPKGGVPSQRQKRDLVAALLRRRAAEARSSHSLSYGQQALWFVHQSARLSAAYNAAFAARVTNAVDEDALRTAFQSLLARHASLRSTFATRGGNVLQLIHPEQKVDFKRNDLPNSAAGELRDAVVREYRLQFDLERGPLMRVNLITRSPHEHVLLVTVHHIVCDAWSLWVIIDEVRSLYTSALAGNTAILPRPEREYSDFVDWQAGFLNSPSGKRSRDYWRKHLAGARVLMLPTDRPRPAVRTWLGDSHSFEVPPDLIECLRGVAENHGATLYMLFLAAFQVLLHRYSHQEEFTIGTLTTGRTRPEFSQVVGYFVNPVVIRANLRDNPRFSDLLSQVREIVLGALEHQDYPFPLVVEQFSPRHDPGVTPLMRVLFVYQKRQTSTVSESINSSLAPGGSSVELKFEPFEIPQMEGQFDLTLEVIDGAKSVLKYDTSLFDKETIVRMAAHLDVLLRAIVTAPKQKVSDFPLLTRPEWDQTIRKWNLTQADYSLDLCLHEQIERQVERTPDAIAVRCEERQLTYRSLNNAANNFARRLRELDVGPDKVVGVCLDRSIELVVALLATLKAGGAYLPLDSSYPGERLNFMATDARILVLLTGKNSCPAELRGLSGCTHVEFNLATISNRCEPNAQDQASPENLAYVIYTSGSTGAPKGTMNTHRGICNRLIWMQREYRLSTNDRVLQKTPFTFDVSVWEFFWPLMNGATIVMAKPNGHRDNVYLADLIRSEGITVLHFVPSMLRVFLEHPGIEKCRSIQQIFCSGEALPVEVQDRCHARLPAKLHNLYGPTEAAVDVTYWPCERQSARPTVPIGRPISNTQIFILDRHLKPVPVGVSGELLIGGTNLARGYLNRADLTAERFIPNPFGDEPGTRLYRTGDLARFLAGGTIVYVGRTDDQVKVRGFRIELPEIERAMLKHPNVHAASVVTHEHVPNERELLAYFIPFQTPAPTTTDLRQFLLSRVPEYMVPQAFIEVGAFPLTSTGKVDKKQLPLPKQGRPKMDSVFTEPKTDTETGIAAVWKDVLRIENVGIHDNFFDLGGTSLRMTQVIGLLEERFGYRVSMVEAFQYPTIHRLAAHLADGGAESSQSSQLHEEVRTDRTLRIQEIRGARQRHRAAGED